MKKYLRAWSSAQRVPLLFARADYDLHYNVQTNELWIFYLPVLDAYLDKAVYAQGARRVWFVSDDNRRFDLPLEIGDDLAGVFEKTESLYMMQTKDKKPVFWFMVPVEQVP